MRVVKWRSMNTEAIWGIVGILATAAAGVWAINDARKEVKEQTTLQRNLAWLRIKTDLVFLLINPTEKAYDKEITKGLDEFVHLSRALEPNKNPKALKGAAENDAIEMAEKLVSDGYASWKTGLDAQRVRETLQEWKQQKDTVREQAANRKSRARVRRFFRRRTKSPL